MTCELVCVLYAYVYLNANQHSVGFEEKDSKRENKSVSTVEISYRMPIEQTDECCLLYAPNEKTRSNPSKSEQYDGFTPNYESNRVLWVESSCAIAHHLISHTIFIFASLIRK